MYRGLHNVLSGDREFSGPRRRYRGFPEVFQEASEIYRGSLGFEVISGKLLGVSRCFQETSGSFRGLPEAFQGTCFGFREYLRIS